MITEKMIHIKDISKILKSVYAGNYYEEIDMQDISDMLEQLSYERVKLSLLGNDLLSQIEEKAIKPISDLKKEPWFGSKYKMYEKPANPRQCFTDEEF